MISENKIIEPTIFTSNKVFIQQLLSFKYFYIILTFLCLFTVYLYNKVAPSEYEVYAAIMSTSDETSSILEGSNVFFNGMQSLQNFNTIEDGITKLRSFSMIYNTIDKLNFEVGYFSEKAGLLKKKDEMYINTPFRVRIHKTHLQPIDTRFYIKILSDSTYRLKAEKNDAWIFNFIENKIIIEEFPVKIDEIFKFGENIEREYLSINITRNPEYKPDYEAGKLNFYFEMYNPELIAKKYLKNLNVFGASASSSIITVLFRGNNLEKSIYFMNSYLNLSFEENLARKNTIARNTINFIDSQLSGISDSLVKSGSEITSYRSANQLMNLSFQGQTAYSNLQQIDRERDLYKSQERYYGYILEYLRTTEDIAGISPPSSMNVDNPVMTQIITDLMNLNSQRTSIINLRGDKNPFLSDIDSKIKSQKQYLIEIASSNLNTVKQNLADLEYRSAKLSRDIASLPRQELNMESIQRKFDIDQSIYTFFLQKRSEATITLASNYPDFTMFEPARAATSEQVSPKYFFNYLIALILGIIIPTAILVLKNLLNFRISNPEFIAQVTGKSPVATIYSGTGKSQNIVNDYPASVTSESFRALRTVLFRKLPDNKSSRIVLVTSAQPREGKSFISLNLATSISMVGKKTLLIDTDLKRPMIHTNLSLPNDEGLSNYISGNASLEKIVRETEIQNLSFISAGPNMPNATEILASGAMDSLIEEAKNKFDFIVLDSSPIGFMADAMLMTLYADHIFLVVRNNYTLKESFTDIISVLDSNNISNYDVILNDKEIRESSYGVYTKYYSHQPGKGLFIRIKT
jgi:capsular exopolysaccharide synthesis family protein